MLSNKGRALMVPVCIKRMLLWINSCLENWMTLLIWYHWMRGVCSVLVVESSSLNHSRNQLVEACLGYYPKNQLAWLSLAAVCQVPTKETLDQSTKGKNYDGFEWLSGGMRNQQCHHKQNWSLSQKSLSCWLDSLKHCEIGVFGRLCGSVDVFKGCINIPHCA